MTVKLKAVWGNDMFEEFGEIIERKPAVPDSSASCVNSTSSDNSSIVRSKQDEDDDLTDSWNGYLVGTTRRQRRDEIRFGPGEG
jgi:hypothetical protein